MLYLLQKVVRYLSFLWSAKWLWSWPQKADILIFDGCGEELLHEYLEGWTLEVLPVRGESINLPVLFVSLSAPGNRSDAYYDVYVKAVKPKLMLTFIDTTLAFYRFSRRHPEVETMFIQNGLRTFYGVFDRLEELGQLNNNLAVDHMMCFGKAIARKYQQYLSGSATVMGSLRNNHEECSAKFEKSSIAYVSQWSQLGLEIAGKVFTSNEFFGVPDQLVLNFLAGYAKTKNKKLYVIPRNGVSSPDRVAEERYFTRILGGSCSFMRRDAHESGYSAIDSADVLVGIDSTLLYEAAARGKKVAFFTIREEMLGIKAREFGWPSHLPPEGSFWTNSASEDKFTEVLDYLFDLGEEDRHRDEEVIRDLMVFDPGNRILKRTLTEVLNKAEFRRKNT